MRKEFIVRNGLIASFMLVLAAVMVLPSRGQEEGPDTASFVYVTNSGAGTVSVIDTTTKHVVATIQTCSECGTPGPEGIAVTPNGRFLYVANYSSNSVGVIDLSTDSLSNEIPLCDDVCPSLVGVAITPDGKLVYVTDNANGLVYKIQTSDHSFTTISVGANPSGIAVDPTGSFVYVTNTGDGTVSVINTATDAVTGPISVGADPTSVAFQPGAHIAYVTDEDTGEGSGAIAIIDTTHNTVSGTIPLTNSAPYFVAFTPDGKSAYVTNQAEGAGGVLVINTATQAVSSTIGLDSTPVQVAITPDGGTAYVAVGSDDAVYPITTGSSPSLGTGIGVGEGASPYGVAVGPVSETQTLDTSTSGQTLTFTFLGGNISFTFPQGWCSSNPCTVTAAATDTPDAVWKTESGNYPSTTDIAPDTKLPGGGMAGGDGYVYTVTCIDSSNVVCNLGNMDDSTIYTASMTWDTQLNICGMGPALGKEEEGTSTWENILATCTYMPDPAAGTSGTSRDGLSRWASFYHVTGTPSATVTIATPTNGAVYTLNTSHHADYSCTGTYSECAASNSFGGQTVPVAPNGALDTSTPGLHTLTAEADVTSGPTAKATVVYFVDATYGVQLLYPGNAAVKSPATFPIKMYVTDPTTGADVSSSSLIVNASAVLFVNGNSSGDTVMDAGNSNADNNFRFDSTLGPSGGYIFNFKTTGLPSGNYLLEFTIGGAGTYAVPFAVK